MHLDCGTVRCFAQPDVANLRQFIVHACYWSSSLQIFALSRLKEEDIVAVVKICQLVELIQLGLRV